jgi:membrane-bound lytic murein transglycosylase F
LLLALLLVCSPLRAQSFSPAYDLWFEEYTYKYLYGLLPEDDWKWLKAQCWQESRLKPEAISPAGAVGLCQLMRGAAQDAGLSSTERTDPQKNIRGAAFILRRNIRIWFPRETRFQRLQLGWAGYNAGAGWIVKAQARCGGPPLWPQIAPCLRDVTGDKNAHETVQYVALIPGWYHAMENSHEQ